MSVRTFWMRMPHAHVLSLPFISCVQFYVLHYLDVYTPHTHTHLTFLPTFTIPLVLCLTLPHLLLCCLTGVPFSPALYFAFSFFFLHTPTLTHHTHTHCCLSGLPASLSSNSFYTLPFTFCTCFILFWFSGSVLSTFSGCACRIAYTFYYICRPPWITNFCTSHTHTHLLCHTLFRTSPCRTAFAHYTRIVISTHGLLFCSSPRFLLDLF